MAGWDRKAGFDLNGRSAVVLGAANASGLAIATALMEAGATVTLATALHGTGEGEAVRDACRDNAGLRGANWDVTSVDTITEGFRAAGPISILIYNADLALARPIERTSGEDYARVRAVNLDGAFFAAREFLNQRPDDVPGRIVFVTSILGERGVDNFTAYGAAKAGVIGLANALSQEVGARNTTVNCISTGWMEWTPGRGADDLGQNLLMRFVPLRRFGKGGELGALAVLLASEAAGYINGQVMHVDGGMMTHL